MYLCGVKKFALQTGSLLMALVVLFVSVGWDVKFHYCTEDHQLTGSFVDAAVECVHCLGHHHEHETEESTGTKHSGVQLNAKCCCEDFDGKIQFADNFVFSPDKHLVVNLQPFFLPHLDLLEMSVQASVIFNNHSPRKTRKFLSGRDRIVFFSSLKINPSVF